MNNKGSQIPSLSCPGTSLDKHEREDIIIWGGQDLNSYSFTNDLNQLHREETRKSVLYDVILYHGSVTYEFQQQFVQSDPKPS